MRRILLTCLVVCQIAVPVARALAPEPVPMVYYRYTKPFQGGSPVFSNEKITISGVFPNPATTSAALEYEITGEIREAKITISNVLGNGIGEYRLTRDNRKLQFDTSDFAPGVYFYTLFVDGKSLFTRKLIIRHSS
ncbi:MAG: T9SS type A sorting domain-containing protein [Cytophagales bacterium]|nr:T9SS type A sorting domain-containing protein [Cytophagales bacterium]